MIIDGDVVFLDVDGILVLLVRLRLGSPQACEQVRYDLPIAVRSQVAFGIRSRHLTCARFVLVAITEPCAQNELLVGDITVNSSIARLRASAIGVSVSLDSGMTSELLEHASRAVCYRVEPVRDP